MIQFITTALLSVAIFFATTEVAPIEYIAEPSEPTVPEVPLVYALPTEEETLFKAAATGSNGPYEDLVKEEFSDAPIMWEIARCESTYRQFDENGEVLKGKVNQLDTGIFQINKKYHLEASQKLGIDIDTPEGNIQYARVLYTQNGTRDWGWSESCWNP